jgi:hypothetical protein
MPVSRRLFLTSAPLILAPGFEASTVVQPASAGTLSPSFPCQEQAVVQEMVTVAHFNPARVKELVGRQPSLVNAGWDWGFGDWESPLGAASHVGNREIAEFLIMHGARPSIFSATMLGQLEVVKAFVAASPGIQRVRGPHTITLLKHATAGGAPAKPVLDYLAALGDADDLLPTRPLTADERTKLAGVYVFGAGAADRIEIAIAKEALTLARPGHSARGLTHLGSYEFYPAGAESVRIRFSESTVALTLTIHDPDVVLTARKMQP